jgi:hypothetical protein
MMGLLANYKKKTGKKSFLVSLKSLKKPDPLVRGPDPGIRIRTKMSLSQHYLNQAQVKGPEVEQ